MHLAAISDVHGSLPALEAVLEDMQPHELDAILVAGDYIGGPQVVETMRLLRSLNSWMIRGNSDTGLLHYGLGNAPDNRYTHRQFVLLRWAHRHVDQETFDFFRSLPEQRVIEIDGTAPIRLVHGSPRNPSESIFPDRDPATLDLALAQTSESVLVCGHTHIPWKVTRDDRLTLNPGAVCGPLNGEVCAQYALLTWRDGRWWAEHRSVSYDLDLVRAAFRNSGLLEEGGALARSFLLSIETGQNVADDFLSYAWRLATQAGFEDSDVVPDATWEQATVTFDWDRYGAPSLAS
jgi:putative phosphoesterase